MYISVAQKLPEIWLETSKNSFWQKPDFVKINEFSLLKLKKCKNRKIDTFTFLAISLAIFELQRRTIPHFNPLNNSFWPYEGPFCCRANSFWAIWPNVRPIFFQSYFDQKNQGKSTKFEHGTYYQDVWKFEGKNSQSRWIWIEKPQLKWG